MRVSEQARYPASPDEVVAVLTDPTFLAERATASGAVEQECEVVPGPAGTIARSRLVVSTAQLPDVARRVVGTTTTVESVEIWAAAGADGVRTGTLSITVHGAPAGLTGDLRLSPTPEGSHYVMEGVLTVRVPLFGAVVERAVEPVLLGMLRSHGDLLRKRLA